MTTKVVPGQLIAAVSVEQVAVEAAARIAKALRNAIKLEGHATLALSGGNTPRAAYALLAKEPLEWNNVDLFWVDERAVPPTHARSNYKMVKEALLDAAPIPEGNVHRMMGEAKDLEAAAKEYEAVIRDVVTPGPDELPAFDAIVLGVGDDGHTASLFPGESSVEVSDRLVIAVPAKGDREARLSVTTPMIEQARAAFVLATGAAKSPALERTWSIDGSVKDTPARVIRGVRGAVTWIIDKAAGGIHT